jgi:N-acetylneuraminic acid mutarotase
MPTPRTGFGAHAVDGKIYAFGGDQECHCSVEVYDPAMDSWERRANMTTPRFKGASALLDGKVYLFAGFPPPNSLTPIVDVYDPAMDTWIQAADLPTPRQTPASCALQGRIYAISSGTGLVEVYDPATDEWQTGPDFPSPDRCWQAAVGVGSKVYVVVGGTEYAVQAALWEYDPER